MMKPSANHCVSGSTGTTGTKTRDRRVTNPWGPRAAALVLGLALAACGGESSTSDDTSGSDDSTNGPTSNTSGGGNSSAASTTSADCSTAPHPGCFGSPGPVTSGVSTSGGAGGGSNSSNDSSTSSNPSSGGSGGSAGASGAGGAGGAACEPQDVGGVGACDAAFGVFFLGNQCGWVSGCSCVGEDCDNGYEDEASCRAAHRECFDDCAPQDVSFVGGCEPASRYAFNGVECVAMDGCGCIGDDCDASYDSPEACAAAHASCSVSALSCDEIEAVYDDYVSHTACQDDSDCAMVWGQCGIGVGGCYHVVNREWGNEGLTALAQAWSNAGCTGPVCDCAEPPDTVICDDGVCAFQE